MLASRPRTLLIVATLFLLAVCLSPRSAAADFPAADLSTDLLFRCGPDNSVSALLNWTPSGQGLQWVDLTIFDNDFAPGTFLSAGSLASGRSGMVWDGLLPGMLHFARVNTLTSGGWFASRPMAFLTPPDCPSATAFPITAAVPSCQVAPVPVFAGLAGCVTTTRGDFSAYAIGEPVVYCYAVNQPMNVRVVATKPDGSQVTVVNAFDNGRGGCIGPFQANVPFGLRTVDLLGGPTGALLSQTHFFVR